MSSITMRDPAKEFGGDSSGATRMDGKVPVAELVAQACPRGERSAQEIGTSTTGRKLNKATNASASFCMPAE